MRVRIVFLLKNRGSFLPFHHQYLLAEMNEKIMSDKLNSFGDYTFSGLKGQTKVSKDGLHYYSTRVTLVLSSSNTYFIDHYLGSLFEHKEIKLGDLELIPESVEQELPSPISETMKFVCISPLVLTNPEVNSLNSKKFIPPDSDLFSDLLYESVIKRMGNSGIYSPEQLNSFYKFQLIPDKEYLTKIKESDKKFARIYPVFDQAGIKQEIRGYTFPFVLHASTEVQQFVFNCGLGALPDKGFGMLDLNQADLHRKTEPYSNFTQPLIAVKNQD